MFYVGYLSKRSISDSVKKISINGVFSASVCIDHVLKTDRDSRAKS